MAEAGSAARRLLRMLEAATGEGTGVHLFVTHDAVLAPFVSRALGIAHVLWPDFLAAAVVWPDGDALRIAFDGRHRTVVDGVPEYFLYDRARNRLAAYRLATPEATSYTAILPNNGLYESRVLGLDVQVEQDRLRFYAGTALLLESEEFIVRLQAMAEDAQRRAEEEARLREEETRLREEEVRLREEETRLREEETRRREEAEQRREEAEQRREEAEQRREEAEQEVARLRAELERLKR